MKRRSGRQFRALGLLSCLLLGAGSASAVRSQDDASVTAVLLSRARILEARGRLDLAKQDWTQVLLTDPNNSEALNGLARVAKAEGKPAEAAQYLSRIRAAGPKDADGGSAQAAAKARDAAGLLSEAGLLARAGDNKAAMALYRQLYGLAPPAGEPALGYYETEAATPEGRPHAIAGLRALADRYPSDRRYKVALGKVLLANPRTRAEGRELLERYPGDPQALAALKQSESTGQTTAAEAAGNAAKASSASRQTATNGSAQTSKRVLTAGAPPAAQPENRGLQVSKAVASPAATPRMERSGGEVTGSGLSQASQPGLTRTSAVTPGTHTGAHGRAAEEQAAYSALNAQRLPDAEARFKAILAEDPGASRSLAGLAYTRMAQGNLPEAIRLFEEAQEHGDHSLALVRALANAEVTLQVERASAARAAGDFARAEQGYGDVLRGKPDNVPALKGLGETLLQEHKPEAALPVFLKLTQVRPSEPAGWRGAVIAQMEAKRPAEALWTSNRVPADAKRQLAQDQGYQQALLTAGQMQAESGGATKPSLPVVSGSALAAAPTRAAAEPPRPVLPQTAVAEQAPKREQPAQASAAAPAVIPSAPPASVPTPNLSSTTPVPSAPVPIAQAQARPAQVAETAPARRPSSAKSRSAERRMTQKAVPPATEPAKPVIAEAVPPTPAPEPKKPSAVETLGLARTSLQQGNAAQAATLYREVLAENSQSAEAWKGLVSALHTSGQDAEALAQVDQIPSSAKDVLGRDPGFFELTGEVALNVGDSRTALRQLARAQATFVHQRTLPPLALEFQLAHLLFESGDEGNLYRELMYLGSRADLSDEQRKAVQGIWTDWALRRARALSAAGEQRRAVVVLNAAAEAFSGNTEVLRRVAEGYTQAGMAKQALGLYKAQDMTKVDARELQSAIAAAAAAREFRQARTWIEIGLQRFPQDPNLLLTAGEAEQMRGDRKRAATYFEQAQKLSPTLAPGAVLATELKQPVSNTSPVRQAGSTGSLSLLLGPAEVNALSTRQVGGKPYLPSYAESPASRGQANQPAPDLVGYEGH